MDYEVSTSHNVLERMLLDESTEPTSLPLSLLQYITNRFSLDHKIGSGGFAVVYKGMVGKGLVAVKKLSNTFGLHENKFHEEVKCLIKAKHKNIVRFLGYCANTEGKMEEYEGKLVMADQRNWLLCFEYVCNGSLDKHITDATCGLDWRDRYQIIRGICEGLNFLHEMRILHLDLKPANILLDGHMVPKITDFGLSRCLSEDQTRAFTKNLYGTLGYIDPEYLRSGQIGFASDIYSLGVVIMEILTGVKRYLEDDYVVESWIKRLDESERGMQLEQVRVCSRIGIECMNLDPKKRPLARHIIDRLDKTTSVEYSDETSTCSSLVERQISLSREQFGERIGKHAAENVQKADVKEDSQILEDVAESFESLHMQESQQKVGQLTLWGVQDAKEKFNHNSASNSSSISTVFYESNYLEFFIRKACKNFDRTNRRTLENSYFINIFSKEELMPIIRSSNFIGKGVRTEVYKGFVDNALVAVKKMIDGNVLEKEQLEAEVIIQSEVIHKNIIWLLGCCLEMDSLILVYEFYPRGSLDNILHNSSKVPLNLDARLNIIAGSACGLAYLHSQTRNRILHGDFKPANILLDDNFIPKISVSGMSRFIVGDSLKKKTKKKFNPSKKRFIVGDKVHFQSVISDKTYMDPVYVQTGLLTGKSDVYSFGIVVLEVISRKKATHTDDFSLVKSFLEVHKQEKKASDLFDKEIAVTADLELLDCLAEMAMECLNLDVDQRPSMTDVAERLLILNQSRRSDARRYIVDKTTSADHSVEVGISNSLVQHKKAGQLSLLGVQDTNHRGTNISRSISTRLYRLNNLDIFSNKAPRNIESNGRRAIEKSSFIKIFRKKELSPIIKLGSLIGKGAASEVYQCVMGDAVVAVKKLINGDVLQYARNEVLAQSQVTHKNIVRLIGCCLEMDAFMLVYEFLSRGSLDDYLYGDFKSIPMDLDVRLSIITESACSLVYLHSQAHSRIRHGAVKPANILLDENLMPKISGFGLSRFIVRDMGQYSNVNGDTSYMDPVYLQTGLVTEQSDVYSFGIVILDLISRKKATHSDNNSLVKSFLDVHKEGKTATVLFDKEIAVTRNLEILDCLAEIAVQCLNLDLNQRPTMTYVAECLRTLQRYHRSQVGRQ